MKRSIEAYVGIPAGLAAPLVYAGAVFVGGFLTPGYSQLGQTISELTAVGAPAAAQLTNVFIAYNLLLACFAVALPAILPTRKPGLVTTAAATLMTVAISGVAMSALFPVASIGHDAAVGWKHVAFAAIASLSTMGAILAVAVAQWQTPRWRWFAVVSAICLAIVICSGIWAAETVAWRGNLAGLAERLTIGTFMCWTFVLAWALVPENLRLSQPPQVR